MSSSEKLTAEVAMQRTRLGLHLPPIPPIERPKRFDDPYAKSKLLKFRLANKKGGQLRKMIMKNAIQVYKETKHFNDLQLMDKEAEPEYPDEMMSKERRRRMNYLMLKSCVQGAPTTPMQQQLYEGIMCRVPQHLKTGPALVAVIGEVHEEIVADFDKSMQKSMVQHVLIRPDIRGLEDDDNVPPTPSPVGLDFSQPWHASVVASKELMLSNLHMCHPTMKLMLEMGHDSLGKILLINCLAYRSQGQLEFETLRNNIILESEKTEEKLKNSWLPSVINIFADKKNFSSIKPSKQDSFFNCVASLMSNQLRDLLTRSIESWVNLFDESNKNHLPLLRMELIYEDNKMTFYPFFHDLEELILFVVQHLSQRLQSVPNVQSWLSGSNTVATINAAVDEEVIRRSNDKLKEAIRRNFEEPKAHLDSFVEKYSYLINGEALREVEKFIVEKHKFEDYVEIIERLQRVAREI